jgi:hypothetical protein
MGCGRVVVRALVMTFFAIFTWNMWDTWWTSLRTISHDAPALINAIAGGLRHTRK